METTLDTGSLWHRGDRIAYAEIVTPVSTWHAWTVVQDGAGLRVEWHGNPAGLALEAVEAQELITGGWRVQGTNPRSGMPEVWRIRRLSCGCQHSGPVPTVLADLPE